MAKGQKTDIQPRNPFPPVMQVGPATAAANGTRQLYYPITITANLAAGALEIRNVALPNNDGIFVPDELNQCTRATSAGANGIIISGRFNGCTFVRWQDAAGVLHVGHVFVDGNLGAANNPGAQIAAFRAAAGVPPGGVVHGFSTIGQVPAGAQYGYVIAVDAAGGWEFHWMTIVAASQTVAARRQLVAADWANL
jgi:hypothetical protein